jgi:hypothetical protein
MIEYFADQIVIFWGKSDDNNDCCSEANKLFESQLSYDDIIMMMIEWIMYAMIVWEIEWIMYAMIIKVDTQQFILQLELSNCITMLNK